MKVELQGAEELDIVADAMNAYIKNYGEYIPKSWESERLLLAWKIRARIEEEEKRAKAERGY